MKKIIALGLAAVFCIAPAFTASAADDGITVTDKNFVIVESSYGNSGYLFARVENTGTETVTLDNGKLVVFGADDEIAATDDYINVYPNTLQPGECGYVCEYVSVDLSAAECQDFKFSVKATDSVWSPTVQFEAVATEYVYNPDNYNSYIVYSEVNNPTEDVIYDPMVVYAIYDDADNFICTVTDSLYDIGLCPGQSVIAKAYLNTDVMAIFTEQAGVTPSKCVATVIYSAEQ